MSRAAAPPRADWRQVGWLLAAVGLAGWAQRAALGSGFFADDFLYLFRMADAPVAELLFVPNAGHLLVFRNLLFFVTWRLFGSDPGGYFAIAWLTHLLNVALLFLLLRRLGGGAALAGVAAALWGCLAVHAGTLGWYAVYGQAIALTLALALLHLALACRTPPTRGVRLLLGGLVLALGSSFGSGLAVALALPLALTLLRPQLRGGRLPPLTLAALLLAVTWATTQVVYADQDVEQLSRLIATPATPPPDSLAARFGALYLQPRAALMFVDLVGHG
ncbi:MAG: hypothetical protein SF182_29430, partial [Deltaproteobacteria bacterium]|nr:hypothetical protein [Deltaproteobacteria bacterium]